MPPRRRLVTPSISDSSDAARAGAALNLGINQHYLCSILDGFSRYIVHWDLREKMMEAGIEIIMQGAKEKYPEARPRIISATGPQFIAKDIKELIRISGMTHVRTSPLYPQSNGKIERRHKSLKNECIRPGTPLPVEDARPEAEAEKSEATAQSASCAVETHPGKSRIRSDDPAAATAMGQMPVAIGLPKTSGRADGLAANCA